jgi:putative DNA primase/helicase
MTDGFRFEGEPETTSHRDDWQEEVGRLAALPGVAYDREREAVAGRLGCRVGTLDKEVARIRGEAAGPGEGTPGAGRPLRFDPPELHPEPVDGAALLLELAGTFRRFLALPKHADTACALWVVHTHAFAASPITPRLAITSPEKRCGKTTLLELVGALVAKPQMASNVSAAATFRTIELCRPTLLIDEADTFLGEAEELRGILNSGHRRSGEVIRVRERDGELEPVAFSTWAPVAIAMIGKLPGTRKSSRGSPSGSRARVTARPWRLVLTIGRASSAT